MLCNRRTRRAQRGDGGTAMDAPNKEFALAGGFDELKAKGRLIVRGGHRPFLVVYDRGPLAEGVFRGVPGGRSGRATS
jgi:hypothetical protein